MRDFICPQCGQHLAFENSVCLSCGSHLGFSLDQKALLVLAADAAPGFVDADDHQLCANLHVAECNWLVSGASAGTLCASCALTRTRPNDADTAALPAFAEAEKAKRRLIAELAELRLPVTGRDTDPEFGLAFDLLSSEQEQVMTGHHNGVITLDLAEGDDVHREQLRISMDEPYRTLLGHFRHEIGHYFYYRLVGARRNTWKDFMRCSAMRTLTTRQPWTAITSKALPRAGRRTMSRPMPRCIPPRIGRRPSRTTCISATPWIPRRPSRWRPRVAPSTAGCLARVDSTPSSRCGCRWPGRSTW